MQDGLVLGKNQVSITLGKQAFGTARRPVADLQTKSEVAVRMDTGASAMGSFPFALRLLMVTMR